MNAGKSETIIEGNIKEFNSELLVEILTASQPLYARDVVKLALSNLPNQPTHRRSSMVARSHRQTKR